MKTSIIIPVRDRLNLLQECIKSLMHQTYPMHLCEIIICDDGSSEDIAPIIKQFKSGPLSVRILRQPPRGPATARNLGIKASAAPVIIFIDSDVIVDKGFILNLTDSLKHNPDWVGVEANIISSKKNDSPLWDAPGSSGAGHFHTAAIAYRREALIKAGGFDETFKLPACEDVELVMRINLPGKIGFATEAVAYHPKRKVTLRAHWSQRLHWRYITILAKRYKILAFPHKKIHQFPRLRVAFAAIITLPIGRLLTAIKYFKKNPRESFIACAHSVFDVVCGLWALPVILFTPVSKRQNYL